MKFYAAVFFRNLLAEQLEVAEDDLLLAAADGPMYGPIYVLRYGFELKVKHPYIFFPFVSSCFAFKVRYPFGNLYGHVWVFYQGEI